MERVPFLRDIENDELYAKSVENAYLLAYEHLGKLLEHQKYPKSSGPQAVTAMLIRLSELCEALHGMELQMSFVIRDMADRQARLANVATGLADVVLDEEGSEE